MSPSLKAKLQRSGRAAAVLAMAGLTAGVMAEVLLLIGGVEHPIFDRPDPVFGSALIEGSEGWQQREGRAYIRVNSRGFRDHERSTAKPPGTLRIAVLGDSFTEARQVAFEATFCSVIEQELQRRRWAGGRTIEVLNFGVSGYGTTQQLLTLQHRVWTYDPDIVLLAFYTGNDISDNSPTLSGAAVAPYHRYRNGELILDRSFVETEAFRARQGLLMSAASSALRHSRLLQLLNHVRLAWKLAARSGARGFAGPNEPGTRTALYAAPTDPAWIDAWRVTEDLLAQMNREATARGLPFLMVSLSSGIQVHPDAALRQAFRDQASVADLFYPDRRVRAVGRREGFPVLLLGPAFQKHAEQRGVFLHGFEPLLGWGHWNEQGHALAGQLIADWMSCELRDQWQDSPSRNAILGTQTTLNGGSD